MQSARFVVSGRVQGVGFRYFVQGVARKLAVRGWVRNLPDGSVECVACGSLDDLADLANQLRRGPALARVTAVDRQEIPDPECEGFEIRPSAGRP